MGACPHNCQKELVFFARVAVAARVVFLSLCMARLISNARLAQLPIFRSLLAQFPKPLVKHFQKVFYCEVDDFCYRYACPGCCFGQSNVHIIGYPYRYSTFCRYTAFEISVAGFYRYFVSFLPCQWLYGFVFRPRLRHAAPCKVFACFFPV